MGVFEKSIILLIKNVQSITTATLTKLLAIRMVANKYSERANRDQIRKSCGFLSSSNSFISCGESEKKAISEAEIKAENPRNITANISVIISPTEAGESVRDENSNGKLSGSKIYVLVKQWSKYP